MRSPLIWKRPGSRLRPSSIRGRSPRLDGTGAGHRQCGRDRHGWWQGGIGHHRPLADRRGAARRRRPCHVGRVQPGDRPRLSSRRPASLVRSARHLSGTRGGRVSFPPGAAAGIAGLGDCLADGARAAERLGYPAAAFGVVEGGAGTGQGAPLWAVARAEGQSLRRLPERRPPAGPLKLAHAEGYGHVELAKRYTTNGMATDQGKLSNLNAHRHPRRSARGEPGRGGDHHLPAVLHAGFLRRAHRHAYRPPLPADPPLAVAWLGREAWRAVRGDRPLAPLLLFPARGRDDLAQSVDREAQAVRAQRRHLRRVDARQDRDLRRRRRGIPQSGLLQRLPEAARRPGPLWPDAARGRLHLRRRDDQPVGRDALTS